MHLKSKFPQPPRVPDANAHYAMFGLPDYPQPEDFTVNIDAPSGRTRSYYELRQIIKEGATALAAPESAGGLGLSAEAGHMVGIYSHNCMDYVAMVNALIYIGVPISLLSAYATPYELAHSLKTSKVTHLFIQPDFLPKALEAAKQYGLPESRIYILEGSSAGRRSFQDLAAQVRARSIHLVAPKEVKRDTLAYLVFSSGTSGLPKAVMISHGNIWAMVLAQMVMKQEEEKITQPPPPVAPTVWLIFLPLYHTYGVHMACFRQFFMPATYVIVPKWDVKLVLKSIPRYRVQVMPLIPSAIHQMVNNPLFTKLDLSTLVSVSSGAAYLPPELNKKFMAVVKSVSTMMEGYGMSEQTLSAIRKPIPGLYGLHAPLGCTGILVPGVEGRIVRPDGSEADFDEPGELWVRGPTIALGYFGNEKATRETFVDGWLHTGDTFKADRHELLYFVDRAKDTLKVSGAQVSPTEIEDTIREHPERLITDVCVAGVAGGRTRDEKIPRAWIVLSEEGKRRGEQTTIATLDDWVKKNLSRYKWLRGGFEVVDAIPKNPTGKVVRRALVDRYEAQLAEKSKL